MLKAKCPFLQTLQLLHQAEVRDLCWVLSSETDLLLRLPPYKRFPPITFTLKLKEWLLALNHRPAPLQAHIAQHKNTQRLGVYFEQLISFYFRYAPSAPYSLVHHGYRIYRDLPNKGRATVGELDFVLKPVENNPIKTTQKQEGLPPKGLTHLEVAVKFFLGVKKDQEWMWLGPNAKDAWHRKVSHIQNHQLAISTDLSAEYKINILHRAFWVKGCFFVPWQAQENAQATAHTELPTNVNSLACQNIWLHAHQVKAFLRTQSTQWRILERKQWLTATPLSATTDIDPSLSKEQTTEELLYLTTEKQQAVMMVDEKTSLSKRVMIVPNRWPDLPLE